ncbi:ATP-binding protein [Campylobacter sp. LR185c]|uniref:argininosuccinate synthase domain-containing protein n=1 Tax=Campylobacter sp. LR185c TaxID=2014525 RepID=UPI001237EF71|nr:argininosuccinate synthase domain-containing protein [Campylobacter sp. LR185c]KAA6226989.1 ATP-binding protein [Campylobacter sp. LR185c]KAA8603568.1 ATP-binding protein [Campylobacter sp. LR185c]
MKALALFSGGLDSMLAIKLITNQNIKVHALNINIGFGGREDKSELMAKRASMAGASFEVIDVRNEYLQRVLFNPKFGYGKHFNPCIDCHAFMFKTALAMLESKKANFIITGEVLGQRPMSQRSDALMSVKRLSGDENDLILRPMCAKNLAPTKPELLGWVDRNKLEQISGRSRKRQLEMAKEFGFEDFESPGGGCLLTIDSFAKKIQDFKKFDDEMEVNDAQLLKYGRHLRLKNGAKLIVGRNELENTLLQNLKTNKYEELKLIDLIGAYSLVDKNINESDLEIALKIALAYSKADKNKQYQIKFKDKIYTSCPFDNKKQVSEFFVV